MDTNERSARTRGAVIGLVVGIALFAVTGFPFLILIGVLAGSLVAGSRAKRRRRSEPVASDQAS
ncbi:MAG: hypothetical protein ACJ77Z_01845 [Thermoleophilaceae bacterium]